MSAWIVSRAHIDYLVRAGLELPRFPIRFKSGGDVGTELTAETASELGNLLWQENRASVAYRYPDDAPNRLPGHRVTEYVYPRVSYDPVVSAIAGRVRMDPAIVLKEIDCYEYQSCEHPGWKESAAKDYCESLRAAAVARIPGYEEAPWGIEEEA